MKILLFRTILAALLCCILDSPHSTLLAQSAAFTFQGRLTDNSGPASGLYEMRFKLFDAVTGGNVVGGPLTGAAIAVNSGVFTVALDFGAGLFNGADRWLEIDVRTNGGSAFFTLLPRQAVTPSPYALYSGGVNAAGIVGTIAPANIAAGTIASPMLADGLIHSNHLAVGSVHSNALIAGSITAFALADGLIHSNHLAAGSVHSNALIAGSVTALALADGSIHSNHLSVGSVHSNALALGSVTADALATGSIHSNHLAVGSVHSNALIAGSVTAVALADGLIHSNHLAAGSVHSNALIAGSITAFALADGLIHSNHLAAGSVHSNALIAGSVTALALADGSIHSNHLSIGSVHSNALAFGSVTADALATGSIHSNHLAVGSVHSNALIAGSVTASALADGLIHSNHLAAGSVHSNALIAGSITAFALADGLIHSNHLAAGSVHSNALIAGSVTALALADGSIHSNHLSVGSVHSNALAFGSVTADALATGSIHSNHLAVGSVHSNALIAGSITAIALADGLIHSNHLAAGSVHSNALIAGSITAFALADGLIHSNHLAAGSVHSNALIAGSVTALALADGSIHSNHLSVGSVHSNALAFGSVTADALATGSIHSNHLAVGSIHSNALAFGSVTADALAVGTIHSNHLAFGSVTTEALAVGSIHSNQLAVGAVSVDKFTRSLSGSFSASISNPNPAFFTYFGVSVAAVGTDKLLVGAYQDSTAWDNGGAAYLMSSNGTLLRSFLSPAPQNQEHFGFAVAAVGQDLVLIGADGNNTGASQAGAAYLFSAGGTLVTTFTNPTPAAADFFGYSVAAVGTDKVLIGAYGDHFGANIGGAAYLFSTNRTLLMTFNNPTPASGDRFGIAVAAVGEDKVLIGADRDGSGTNAAGVAYLFHVSGALLATFTNPTPASGDAFGSALTAVASDKVLIGANGDNSNGNAGGAAYLFDTSGTLLTTLTNPASVTGDQFGISVAAVGADKVLIGAASNDSGATDAGAAYLFNIDGTLLNTFRNPAPANGDHLGNAVTLLGADLLVIAASQDDGGATDSGQVHLWKLESYIPSLMADTVRAGSITTSRLDDGAVTAAKMDSTIGVWTRSGNDVYRSSGKVGVGTSSPAYPLDVAGPVRISNFGDGAEILNLSTERSWSFRQLSSGAGTALELASIGGGGNKNFIINTTGRVGIGTTTPLATLQVSGNNSQLVLQDTGRGNAWHIYTENHPNAAISGNLLFFPTTGGTYGYIQRSSGNYFSSSDARLKQDVNTLGSVLDRVLQLRPVSYRFKSAPDGSPTLGFIAQEVEPLFPEVVGEHDGMKSLAYSALVPVAIGAIQELNQKLEQKLQQKEAEITELKRSVDELKELVNTLARKVNGVER